jgi:hypothetical protein
MWTKKSGACELAETNSLLPCSTNAFGNWQPLWSPFVIRDCLPAAAFFSMALLPSLATLAASLMLEDVDDIVLSYSKPAELQQTC